MTSSQANVKGLDLTDVVQRLKRFASPSLAANWDNVGLLVEPTSPHIVKHVLLTNDLTEKVLDEAIQLKTNMIISYHPPIFQKLKKLTQGSWKERIIVRCIENRIAVYSPHTILDALKGGVTDWLISPFGGKIETLKSSLSSEVHYSVTANLPDFNETVRSAVAELSSSCQTVFNGSTTVMRDGTQSVSVQLTCKEKDLQQVISQLAVFSPDKNDIQAVKLVEMPLEGCGDGRLTRLEMSGLSLREVVERTKSHLNLSHVRLALANNVSLDSMIKSIAVCAGSGASVLSGVKADVYVTGEMSHHDVLDACHHDTSVILCEHSNTERGYLTVLCDTLDKICEGSVTLQVSRVDKDPLQVV